MNIFRRTVTLFILTDIAILAVLIIASNFLITNRFAEQERNSVTEDVGRLRDALDSQLSGLLSKNGDWSNWDDVYIFAEDHNEDFLTVNQTDNSFVQLQLSAMLFFDQHGALVHNKAINIGTGDEVAFAPTLAKQASSLLFPEDALVGEKKAFILDGDKAYLATARPILQSDGTGPNHGTLIFMREIDASFVSKLSETIHITTDAYLSTDKLPVGDQSVVEAALKLEDIFVRAFSKTEIEGYLVSRDISGEPILTWRTVQSRDIFIQGQRTVRSFLLFFVVVGAIYGSVIIFALYRIVLRRLSLLADTADRISTLQTFEKRLPVSGHDEITQVAKAVNSLLERLVRSLDTIGSHQKELEGRNRELELFNQTMVDRELRMKDLKKEVAALRGSAERIESKKRVITRVKSGSRPDLLKPQHPEQYFAIIEDSPILVWAKRVSDWKYFYINKSFANLFDLSLADVKKQDDFDLWPKNVAEQLRADDTLVLEKKSAIEFTEEAPLPNGQVRSWLSYKFPLQLDGNEELVAGMAIDVTELLSSEEEEKILNQALINREERMGALKEELRLLKENMKGPNGQ